MNEIVLIYEIGKLTGKLSSPGISQEEFENILEEIEKLIKEYREAKKY